MHKKRQFMLSRSKENIKHLAISSLYDYIFGNKARVEPIHHLAIKKEKKVSPIKQCRLMLMVDSPLGLSFSDLTCATYILSSTEFYLLEDFSKPVAEENCIEKDSNFIEELWLKLTKQKIPFDKSSQLLSPKLQRIITARTEHAPLKNEDEIDVTIKKTIIK